MMATRVQSERIRAIGKDHDIQIPFPDLAPDYRGLPPRSVTLTIVAEASDHEPGIGLADSRYVTPVNEHNNIYSLESQ